MFVRSYCERTLHTVIRTPSGKFVLLDVVNTPDCGWEGAYSELDEDIFRECLNCAVDEEEQIEFDFEDVCAWGEESGAFDYWTVVSSHHRNPEIAERNLRKAVAKLK